jgi:hypothetical protein
VLEAPAAVDDDDDEAPLELLLLEELAPVDELLLEVAFVLLDDRCSMGAFTSNSFRPTSIDCCADSTSADCCLNPRDSASRLPSHRCRLAAGCGFVRSTVTRRTGIRRAAGEAVDAAGAEERKEVGSDERRDRNDAT